MGETEQNVLAIVQRGMGWFPQSRSSAPETVAGIFSGIIPRVFAIGLQDRVPSQGRSGLFAIQYVLHLVLRIQSCHTGAKNPLESFEKGSCTPLCLDYRIQNGEYLLL